MKTTPTEPEAGRPPSGSSGVVAESSVPEPVEEIKPKPAKKPRKSKKNEIKEADQH